MSDVIRLLPDSVANQIAAGEVIQRPASVVKELVENSVDAGAKFIQVILEDSGRTLIHVIDDGKGMTDTDARLAFERHATSKISKADDLFALHTMGFRGEALASIAAISQVELRTQQEGKDLGTRLLFYGSNCEMQEPIYYGKGTSIMVKNIFFNVPVRRKFLKSNQVELSNILKEFERLALVNPSLELKIVNNDKVYHHLRPGSFKERISQLFGRTFETQLVPVKVDTSLVTIDGFVGRPENSRKKNQQQFLFVNGRYMRHPYFHKAILASYEHLIPADEQPNYFINFTVDPSTIDVNIHPTKTEIKFENEQPIFQIIMAAVKEAVGRVSVAPSIDFDKDDCPAIPVFNPDFQTDYNPQNEIDVSYNPFEITTGSTRGTYRGKIGFNNDVPKNWQDLYDGFFDDKPNKTFGVETTNPTIAELQDDSDDEFTSDISSCQSVSFMQFKGKYIMSAVKSGLMIIDQHRAHIRIQYEKFASMIVSGKVPTQGVLFPETIHLSVAESVLLDDIIGDMNTMGFDMAFLGNGDWAINGIPADIDNISPETVVHDILESVSEGGKSKDTVRKKIALVLARRSAIPYGKSLSVQEMDSIQNQLLSLPEPNYTPDGKLIIHILKTELLNKSFQ